MTVLYYVTRTGIGKLCGLGFVAASAFTSRTVVFDAAVSAMNTGTISV